MLIRRYKVLAVLLALNMTFSPIFAKSDDNFTSLIDKYKLSHTKIYPTENLNVDIKINKRRGIEQYTFYDKDKEVSNTYILKDNNIIEHVEREDDLLDIYSVLYKSGSSVIHPDEEDVYFSRVSLYDDVIHIHQEKTGEYSLSNCVPSSIAMAYNWSRGLIGEDAITVEKIREEFPSMGQLSGEGSAGYDIYSKDKIYTSLGVEHKLNGFICDASVFLDELNEGKLINMTVNTEHLPKGDRLSNIDKSYSGGGSHSLLCTGYLYLCVHKEDGTDWERTFLEIVDPAETNEGVRYYNLDSVNEMLVRGSYRYITISYAGEDVTE